MIKRRYLGTALIVASVAMMGCSSDDDDDDGGATGGETPTTPTPGEAEAADPAAEYDGVALGAEADIATLLTANPEYSTLVTGLQTADLVTTFTAGMTDPEGEYTVFAPNNAAFELAGITAESIAAMEVTELTSVLELHAVADAYTAADLGANSGRALTSLNDQSLLIGGGVEEDEAAEEEGDSLIDEVDEVLEEAEEEVTGDTDTTPITITAGGEGATVVAADTFATNGVIHGIDAVLTMPEESEGGEGEGGETPAGEAGDNALSQAIAADAELSSLATVLASEAVTIDSAFDNPEETWTVFAPTNEALEGVTLPDGQENVTIGYHIASAGGGNVFDAETLAGIAAGDGSLQMTQGGATTITGDAETGLQINGANIVGEPIEVENGLIHKIDAVLTPMGDAAEPPATPADGATDDGATDDGAEEVPAAPGEEDVTDEGVVDEGEEAVDEGAEVVDETGDDVDAALEEAGEELEDAGEALEEATP